MPDVDKVQRERDVVEILIKFLYSMSMIEAGRNLEADLTDDNPRKPETLTFVHPCHLYSRLPQKYSECRPESGTKRDYSRIWHLRSGSFQSAMPHPFCDFHGSSSPT